MTALSFALVAVVMLVGGWLREARKHQRLIKQIEWRIHVNGIRGKSTVTRMIAGMLRDAGLETVGKSTGTAAAVIDRAGEDQAIHRVGPATILEQIRIVRDHCSVTPKALVIECMALKPAYQSASETMIVRSNIGVLTNVREDHQDVMGESLPEIARSLMSTCPTDGILVTAEQESHLVEIIKEIASANNTRVIVADPAGVTDEDLERFSFVSFKENVAIALAVAELIGIDREVAMQGMVNAPPDPGVLRMRTFELGGKTVTWANLFAVNDRESMIAAMGRLDEYRTADTLTVGILNNRTDRERRAIQFADVAVKDLAFDRLATFGAYEARVSARLMDNGFSQAHIVNLGEDRQPTLDQILDGLIFNQEAAHVLLVGFVNIHTAQAELLVDYFDTIDARPDGVVVDLRDDAAVDLPRLRALAS